MLGLGWPEWLLIVGLVGGLLITFKVMARASLAYAKAREMREAKGTGHAPEDGDARLTSHDRNEDREGKR